MFIYACKLLFFIFFVSLTLALQLDQLFILSKSEYRLAVVVIGVFRGWGGRTLGDAPHPGCSKFCEKG